MSRKDRIPSYRLHKPTGQAVVTLSGRDCYLGVHGTPESHAAYARLIAEWLAAGRHLPPPARATDVTVSEVLIAYLKFAEGYYVKGGQPTTQLDRVRRSLAVVQRLYGETRAATFGPTALRAVRAELVRQGLCRRYVNQLVDCVKRCWKWSVSQELAPSSVYESLRTVEGLRRGRTEARESAPILPVSDAQVEAVIPHLTRDLIGMVRVGRWSAMRPGEICAMRIGDLDRTGPVWFYRPDSHKTEHHGRDRIVPLGPRAQAVLRDFLPLRCPACGFSDRPYRLGWNWSVGLCGPCADLAEEHCICGPWPAATMVGDPDTHIFSPRESQADRYREMRLARVSPMTPSQRRRDHVRSCGRRDKTSAKWNSQHAQHAILRECKRHGVEPWHMNQLRHTFASEVRAAHGLEAAQVILGHSRADVTQVYAERDMTLAARVAAAMG